MPISIRWMMALALICMSIGITEQPAMGQTLPSLQPGQPSQAEFRTPKGKSFALLIANETYQGDKRFQLTFPIRDVEKVAAALERHHGFKVEIARNQKSNDLESTIKAFFQRHGKDPAARLFLWYAGHGTQIETAARHRQSFLLPVDIHLSDDPAEAGRQRDQIEIKGLKIQRIAEYIDDFVKSRQVMVVIDSCFAGAIFEEQKRSVPQNFVPVPVERWSRPVRYVIAAGNARQEVFDDGKFADHFVLAISGESPSLARIYREFVTGQELGNHLIDVIGYRRPGGQRPRHRHLGLMTEQEGEFIFELPKAALPPPVERTQSKTALVGGQMTLDAMAERCLTWRRRYHPLSPRIALQVAEALNPSHGDVEHAFDRDQKDQRGQPIVTEPDAIISVDADGARVRVRYARRDDNSNFGDLVLIPISIPGASSDSFGQFVLRGAWSRHGSGFGCVEIALDVRTGRGKGRFYREYRNRLDFDVPYLIKIPLTSTLVFAPRGK